MQILQKKGNLDSTPAGKSRIDWLELEWYEAGKKILRKHTVSGKEIAWKSLNETTPLTEGDILYRDEKIVIAVSIIPCEVLVISPKNFFEMASVCYEIGNKHLPLFYEKDELLVPYEKPLFRLLSAQGYTVRQEKRKLLQQLRTTVSPHGHSESKTLFSRIMKLTSADE